MTRLLSFDPSSTACGAAFWSSIEGRNPEPNYLHVIRPKASLSAIERIDLIVEGVLEIGRRFLPDVVVIETSEGHQAGRKTGRMRGLATMGNSQGRVYQALEDARRLHSSRFNPDRIECVGEGWTGGRNKEARALELELIFPMYRGFAARDAAERRGRDAADAMGLGYFYIAKYKVEAIAGATR